MTDNNTTQTAQIPEHLIKQWFAEVEAEYPIVSGKLEAVIKMERLAWIEGRKAQYRADHPEVPENDWKERFRKAWKGGAFVPIDEEKLINWISQNVPQGYPLEQVEKIAVEFAMFSQDDDVGSAQAYYTAFSEFMELPRGKELLKLK